MVKFKQLIFIVGILICLVCRPVWAANYENVKIYISNSYSWPSYLSLKSAVPNPPTNYCPSPASQIQKNDHFKYGLCGSGNKGVGDATPYVEYALYDKRYSNPILICRIDYWFDGDQCGFKISSTGNIATCAAQVVPPPNPVPPDDVNTCLIYLEFSRI